MILSSSCFEFQPCVPWLIAKHGQFQGLGQAKIARLPFGCLAGEKVVSGEGGVW